MAAHGEASQIAAAKNCEVNNILAAPLSEVIRMRWAAAPSTEARQIEGAFSAFYAPLDARELRAQRGPHGPPPYRSG
eukprot:6267580-Pyramimonas_sp.AAC.1